MAKASFISTTFPTSLKVHSSLTGCAWRRRWGDVGLFIESCCCRVNGVRQQHSPRCHQQGMHHGYVLSPRVYTALPELFAANPGILPPSIRLQASILCFPPSFSAAARSFNHQQPFQSAEAFMWQWGWQANASNAPRHAPNGPSLKHVLNQSPAGWESCSKFPGDRRVVSHRARMRWDVSLFFFFATASSRWCGASFSSTWAPSAVPERVWRGGVSAAIWSDLPSAPAATFTTCGWAWIWVRSGL